MPYLTPEEYVARFGQIETTRLTDEERSGTSDDVKVETAIRDATEFVDGYVGVRYSIPLLDPPRVLQSIVAALAREALHKSRPTPEVTAAADRARAQLKDISAGRMTLPVEEGQTAPASTEPGSALSSGDRATSVFTDAALDGFTSLGRGGYDPCWRRL